MKDFFKTPEQFSGKTLNQLAGQFNFNPEVLGEFLGVKRDAPLQAGQTFGVGRIPGVDPSGSAELQFLSGQFGKGVSPEQQAAQDFATQQAQTLQQSQQQAVGTLESGKAPLKQRYDDLIASIKGTSEQRVKEAETATAREFGKRGVPLTSGVFDQALQGARAPIDAATASALAGANVQEQSQLNQINSAIAQIQQATGQNQVQAALTLFQIGENARQQGLSLAESARQFDEQLGLQKEQFGFQRDQAAQAQQPDQFTTLSEGQTLFNLLTGQPQFTAPKTYKPTTGGGTGGFDESTWD